jgi:hypothetical protein
MSAGRWVPQHISITILSCDDQRIVLQLATLENGAVRQIYFTESEWEDFKRAGDRHMRAAQCRGDKKQ